MYHQFPLIGVKGRVQSRVVKKNVKRIEEAEKDSAFIFCVKQNCK